MWEILTRESLFDDMPYLSEIEDYICSGQRPPLPTKYNPQEFVKIITTCWSQV
jgi:hypothetical protein